MAILDDNLLDFSVIMPRVLVAEGAVLIDSIRQIVLFTDEQIVVEGYKRYVTVKGSNMILQQLEGDRVFIEGEVESVQFNKS